MYLFPLYRPLTCVLNVNSHLKLTFMYEKMNIPVVPHCSSITLNDYIWLAKHVYITIYAYKITVDPSDSVQIYTKAIYTLLVKIIRYSILNLE